MNALQKTIVSMILIVVVIGGLCLSMVVTIPAGHVGVGTLFGSVQKSIYKEGLNFPVNPLVKIIEFDAREKTKKVKLAVPSQDQLNTSFDISIQYRLIKSMAPTMLSETGTPQEVIDVHMTPLMNSATREIGKSVTDAELFFEQTVQKDFQKELLARLTTLTDKGIAVTKIFIRKVQLPDIIVKAVEAKKLAAQAADRAKEELKKFKIDQDRKKTQALAEKEAEVIEAQKKAEVALTIANGNLAASKINAQATLVRATAEAEAKKKAIAVVGLPGYIKLETAKVLPKLANGNHIIMMDPKGKMLPFMDMNKFK